MAWRSIGLVGRTWTGAVILLAVFSKLADQRPFQGRWLSGTEVFAEQLRIQGVVPAAATPAAAKIIVGVEIVVSAFLLSHMRPARAAWAGIGLMLLFSFYLVVVYIKHGDMTCGCFGALSRDDLAHALIRNAILAGILVPSVCWTGRSRFGESADPAVGGEPN
jgi:hypothetical protein